MAAHSARVLHAESETDQMILYTIVSECLLPLVSESWRSEQIFSQKCHTNSALLTSHSNSCICFSRCSILQAKNSPFLEEFPCILTREPLWQYFPSVTVNLIYDLSFELDLVKMNQHAKYLGQKSFHCKSYRLDTYKGDRLL